MRPLLFAPLMACLLTLALWFASTLGLVHGVLHVPGVPQARSVEVGNKLSFVLFTDHHDGDAQCRLYDQLSHGPAAIGVPMIALPLVLPTATLEFLRGEALVRWVALFQARGPPCIR